MVQIKIAQFVKMIRKEHGYTQEDFGKKILGISKRQVTRLESGEAELSMEQFLSIIQIFNLDGADILSELMTIKGPAIQIKKILFEVENPTNNFEHLLEQVEDLLDTESKLSVYNQEQLMMLHSLCNYKITQDASYLDYITNHVRLENLENYRIMNITIYFYTNEQLVSYLKTIQQKKIKENDAYLIKVLINSLGSLVQRKYTDKEFIQKLFEQTRTAIINNRAYICFPLLYFHMMLFYKQTNNHDLYQAYKRKAVFFAEEYGNKTMVENIENELAD
ncbi:helix-turn-helix transcriptional regulator [Listeria booriae]|uniref:helix-turn-helix domain-containing protein n=1 Tax=Listeria booriae TaxID=1552123 RepID=UPI00288012E2|nr:helix-turn-helix transcriptional regulator [Listeria booriae]MDT0109662.1 helix-turn-helix transcriptional regulator [Listeria booriae]